MNIGTLILAAAFVASEGGEELRLFQTTEAKDFRLEQSHEHNANKRKD